MKKYFEHKLQNLINVSRIIAIHYFTFDKQFRTEGECHRFWEMVYVEQLVQDAVYILTVPHTCPDVPAMREMPIILYYEDRFKYPPFNPTYVVSIDDVIDKKFYACHLNESQVYEWLPYTFLQTVPEGEEARLAWLKGEDPATMTDAEILSHSREDGYAIRFAQTAARFRAELIARYGEDKGAGVRYAEAFELGEYGKQPNEEEAAILASL